MAGHVNDIRIGYLSTTDLEIIIRAMTDVFQRIEQALADEFEGLFDGNLWDVRVVENDVQRVSSFIEDKDATFFSASERARLEIPAI